MKLPLLTFNGGEVSPLLHHRSDLAKYLSWCRTLENFIVKPQGGISRRLGTVNRSRIGDVGGFNGARVIAWNIDRENWFQCVFHNSEVKFFNNLGILVYTMAGLPYLDGDLKDIYTEQINDVMYIAHPDYPVYKISRITQFEWEIDKHAFKGGAYGTINTDTTKVMNMALVNPSPNGAPFDGRTDYDYHWPLDQTSLLTALGTLAPNNLTLVGTAALITNDAERTEVLEIPDGANNVTLASNWTLGVNDTIAMWIKPIVDAATDIRARLLSGTGGSYLEYDYSAGTGRLIYYDGSATYNMSNVYIEPNKWSLLIINSDDSDDARVWVNNKLVINNQSNVFSTNFTITDLGDFATVTDGMDVRFSNVKFYDDDLSETDRTALFEANDISYDVTLESSTDQFAATDVDRLVRIAHDEELTAEGSYTANTISDSLTASGARVVLRTEGSTWAGTLYLEKSVDGGTTWEKIGSIRSQNNYNGEIEREVTEYDALVRVNYDDTSGTCQWVLTVKGDQYTHLKITDYTSERVVSCSIESGIQAAIQTWEWALGAFSDTTGYPTCLIIHEERMFLGGVVDYPSSIWASQTNDWENWLTGTLDTSGLSVTLNNDTRNRIIGMITDTQLIILTNSSEWTLGARDTDSAITPTNIRANKHSNYGSQQIQPVEAGNNSYFVEAGGRRVRDIKFIFEADGYVSSDMNILSPHLTQDFKFTRLAYSRSPDILVWGLREDGKIMTFTIEQTQNVAAWSQQPMGDSVVIDINSYLTTDGDEITMLVERDDGVYYEVIQQENYNIDALVTFDGIDASDVLALPGAESYKYFNEDLVKAELSTILNGTGCFLRTDIAITTLVIKYDGDPLVLGVDYMPMGGSGGSLGYWLPDCTDESLITVFDFTSVVSPANYYTVDAADTYIAQVTDSTIDIADLDVVAVSTTLTEHTHYWKMTGDQQILIIDPDTAVTADDITLEDTGVPTDTNAYTVFTPRLMISTYGETNTIVYFGLEMTSIAKLVDCFNNPQSGGAGTRNRITQADIFLTDSMAGEISCNDGEDWTAISYLDPDVVMGEELTPFTGKIQELMQDGYQDEAHVAIRSTSPYNLTITALGLNFNRQSGK